MAELSAADIVDALDTKYGQTAQNNQQWIVIPEARSGAGFDGNNRQCDYLAINAYKGRGLQLIGHEIKVSAADWRRELEEPEKAEAFARFCLRWWVVMPSALAREAKPEIPPTWGLMSVSDKGRITETVKAPKRQPADVPVWWWIGWMAQLDRRFKKDLDIQVAMRVRERFEAERGRIDDEVQAHVDRRMARVESALAMVDSIKEATGIDLYNTHTYTINRLAKIWKLASNTNTDLEYVARQVRNLTQVARRISGGARITVIISRSVRPGYYQ